MEQERKHEEKEQAQREPTFFELTDSLVVQRRRKRKQEEQKKSQLKFNSEGRLIIPKKIQKDIQLNKFKEKKNDRQ